jgi:dsDNA-specific endonuclease/ATPase MutS2
MDLQKRVEIKEEIRRGLSPSLKRRIYDTKLFTILQKALREKAVVKEVVVQKIVDLEKDLMEERIKFEQKMKEAEQTVEEAAADFLKNAHERVDEIIKLLDESENKANEIRKEVNQEAASASTNSPT